MNVGDGHAGQGNGEVDITAMETSLIGRLQLIVHKNQHLNWPRAETPTHYIAMGTDSALVKATKTAKASRAAAPASKPSTTAAKPASTPALSPGKLKAAVKRVERSK